MSALCVYNPFRERISLQEKKEKEEKRFFLFFFGQTPSSENDLLLWSLVRAFLVLMPSILNKKVHLFTKDELSCLLCWKLWQVACRVLSVNTTSCNYLLICGDILPSSVASSSVFNFTQQLVWYLAIWGQCCLTLKCTEALVLIIVAIQSDSDSKDLLPRLTLCIYQYWGVVDSM